MWPLENLTTSKELGILKISINREEKLNALNVDTLVELKDVIQSVYDDSDIKAVIITGSGTKAFAAGADISEISELDQSQGLKFAEFGQNVFQLIEECPKPVIAAVNGFALGGGCELAMACHIRVALKSAKFGQPEVNLGIIPGYGGTQRLSVLIGRSRALELMLTGDIIKAEQALQFGLVNYLADTPEQLIETCHGILEKIMAKAPVAISKVIECVNSESDVSKDGYKTESLAFSECCNTSDFVEGTAAFLEKRNPNFQGI